MIPLSGARVAAPLLALLLAVLGGCSPAPPRPDLVLVSIDTLRADRVGAYGHARDTTPALDRLAAEGLVFEAAVAESSWTLPAHVTMLAGLHPATHHVTHPVRRAPEEVDLLAEELGAAGYRSVALTGGAYLSARYGLDQGFARYDDAEKSFEETVDRALGLLRTRPRSEPLFLFLHTYDVHCPYDPDPAYRGRFASPGAEPVEVEGRCGAKAFAELDLSEGQLAFLSDRYDETIRQADDALARLLEGLRATAAPRGRVVAVLSDHGEEFGEHGRVGHKKSLHRELLLVPFVLAGTGIPTGRVREPVGLVDVAPTLLDALGLPVPEGMEGRVVGRAAEEGGAPPRVSDLYWRARLRSVWSPPWHLIVGEEDGARLYDVQADPREQRDRSADHPEVVERLRAALVAHDRGREPLEPQPVRGTPPKLERRLRALGYLE